MLFLAACFFVVVVFYFVVYLHLHKNLPIVISLTCTPHPLPQVVVGSRYRVYQPGDEEQSGVVRLVTGCIE